jgi:hypothetical protein
VDGIVETRSEYKILMRKPVGENVQLEDIKGGGRMTLRWIYKAVF